jgi:hypothetical protein
MAIGVGEDSDLSRKGFTMQRRLHQSFAQRKATTAEFDFRGQIVSRHETEVGIDKSIQPEILHGADVGEHPRRRADLLAAAGGIAGLGLVDDPVDGVGEDAFWLVAIARIYQPQLRDAQTREMLGNAHPDAPDPDEDHAQAPKRQLQVCPGTNERRKTRQERRLVRITLALSQEALPELRKPIH